MDDTSIWCIIFLIFTIDEISDMIYNIHIIKLMIINNKRVNDMNRWLTSDIKIHKTSVGDFDCSHKYQGMLIELGMYENRTEARREAVKVLMQKKAEYLLEQDEIIQQGSDNSYYDFGTNEEFLYDVDFLTVPQWNSIRPLLEVGYTFTSIRNIPDDPEHGLAYITRFDGCLREIRRFRLDGTEKINNGLIS